MLVAKTVVLFCRDCEQAENWMSNRENFLQADEVDSKEEKIEMMIKKHEDFDKAIGNQEVSVQFPVSILYHI
jgi:spectrin alpha